jgi:hypothetical protein
MFYNSVVQPIYDYTQRRRSIDNLGGQIFIYSCSAQLISFEIDCFYSLWTRIYEYLPPQLSIFRSFWLHWCCMVRAACWVFSKPPKTAKPCSTNNITTRMLQKYFDILNWADLSTGRQIHKCVLVFKCLNNLVPEYLSGYFVRNSNIHSWFALT